MNLLRIFKHIFTTGSQLRRNFSPATMERIRAAIAAAELRHTGELRFAVEADLPISALLAGQTSRARAVEVFSRLNVWDTEKNNGVLIYLMLADRGIEIISDRGIHARVGAQVWESICGEMERSFAAGRFEQGVILAINAVSDLLVTHFPADGELNPNELPDEPVIL